MPYKDTISKSAQNVYSAGTCTLSASTHAGYATRMFEAHLSPATTVDSHSTWHTNLYPYSFTLHRLHRVQGVPHVATCYGPHAVCRMPHATSRVLCVQLLSRRLSTQIVPISVNKMLTFSLKLRSTQLDMPPTQAQTHSWTQTQTHTQRHTQTLGRRGVCFACLSWFYTLLRRLIVLLLFNAILLVLANFELSSRFGLNLKAVAGETFEMR